MFLCRYTGMCADFWCVSLVVGNTLPMQVQWRIQGGQVVPYDTVDINSCIQLMEELITRWLSTAANAQADSGTPLYLQLQAVRAVSKSHYGSQSQQQRSTWGRGRSIKDLFDRHLYMYMASPIGIARKLSWGFV